MHILILTASKVLKNLLHYAFGEGDCFCKTVCSLSDVFIEIRKQVPDCIILDKDFFPGSYTVRELREYIYTDIFFKKFNFPIFLYEKHTSDCFKTPIFQSSFYKNDIPEALTKALQRAVQNLETSMRIPDGFRPVEKKLYTLLKNRAEEELSLEEMCRELWGEQTNGNTKTLYTYIYRIKHILEENVSSPETLIKAKKGCYKLTLFPYESL